MIPVRNKLTHVDVSGRLIVDGFITAYEVEFRNITGAKFKWQNLDGNTRYSSTYENMVKASVRDYNRFYKKDDRVIPIRF